MEDDEATNIPPEEMGRFDQSEEEKENFDGPVLIELGNDHRKYYEEEESELEEDEMNTE